MKEFKEKERLIKSLAICDNQILKFENCLLNLRSGKVMNKKQRIKCATK